MYYLDKNSVFEGMLIRFGEATTTTLSTNGPNAVVNLGTRTSLAAAAKTQNFQNENGENAAIFTQYFGQTPLTQAVRRAFVVVLEGASQRVCHLYCDR